MTQELYDTIQEYENGREKEETSTLDWMNQNPERVVNWLANDRKPKVFEPFEYAPMSLPYKKA